ncbi:MAG: helicase [Betaproteobacteria bacterium HGW-Betaproteobacteria-16]|nr:MAG: helicase [Betaproteobacteria bacterium HGW-Betaproteobacteria-16]
MGRKSQVNTSAATMWLPGFEPADFDASQLNVHTPFFQVAAPPPSPARAVAVASAIVALQHVEAHNQPVAHSTREALSVLSTEDFDDMEPSVPPAPGPVVAIQEAAPAVRHWPRFDFDRLTPATDKRSRIKASIDAITLAKSITSSGNVPSDDERHQLLQYIGWGGLAQVFEDLAGNPYAVERDTLKSLLSDDEFTSARASTTSAFYTDPLVVEAMWGMVKRMGFSGGRIIEPSAGTGMFLAGMPIDIARQSELTAVELDAVSGEILERAFGDLGVSVQISGIEKANVPHGFYDLCIGNVPFGEHRTLETRKVGYGNWLIHNYFFGKAVDMVRPGGLIVLITSTGTLDSMTESHRKWLDAHAEMLGAIRLPCGAFKKQAGTDVATDIVVLKKRAAPSFASAGKWIERAEAPESMMAPGQSLTYYDKYSNSNKPHSRTINAWFVEHPGMVVGSLKLETGQYGRSEINPIFQGTDDEFALALRSAAAGIPADVYQKQVVVDEVEQSSHVLQRIAATTLGHKPGSFVIHDGRIHISEGATWIDADSAYKGAARERVLGLVKVRDAARRLIEVQISSQDDSVFKADQLKLNVVYDAFVAKFGNVGDRANVRVFRSDPDCPLVLSLESFNEDEERFEKAAIFTQRTAGKREPPATAASVKDAMLISLGLYGRINPADMSKRLNASQSEVERGLRDDALAYVDPQDGYWKPADEYLSGHIRNKIATAKAAGGRFAANVLALESVLPKDLGPGEVEVRLGAPWVPVQLVEKFTLQLIEAKPGEADVSYDAQSATWSIKTQSRDRVWVGNRLLNTAQWGTSDRSAIDLIEAALNQVPPKITRKVGESTVVDKVATMAAREKYEAIKAEFRKWAYSDDARRDQLLRIYNDEFNQIVERKYDGSHLVLYGMSNAIKPYQHQLDAIWRIVSGGNTLLAHVVGAGKTFTMVAAAMELRRIGKAKKPCIAVPNHMLLQFAGEFLQFFPTAKVLAASKDDLCGDRRREFAARVSTGDWDAVIMTHSSFEKLPLRPETMNRFLDQMMGQARLALSNAQDGNAKRTVKQLEKLLKVLEAKLERKRNDAGKDDFISFDELGFDHIMIDEAHLHKSLLRVSKMPSIAGLPNVSSNRAFDLWAKTSVVMEQRGDREEGVTFATATPIANSVSEAHVMMRYLQPYTLKAMGLYEFDAWAATFGEAVQGMEVAPDGSGYRLNTRFSRFTNVADLMSIFRLMADIKTRSMLNLPTPSVKGGKPQTIVAPGSADLRVYTDELVERASKIRNGQVEPKEDNMLSITNCGRKAALDMRLVNPALPFDPNGKVAKARDNILRIWKETTHFKGTQLVFCDLSTPNGNGFSVYTDLANRLVDAGIPREEIAFIHDYDSDTAKAKLFRMVRAGVVRVLMGSTQKMGVGTNVQRRLKALHHLDVPWRPADIEQRDGRAWRAGNMCDEIELWRYVTEASFDAYSWQLLETKARFIDQIMGSSGLRTVEDLSMGALTYAEIKALASGNPMVLEKASVDADVMKYSVLRDQFDHDRWRWQNLAKSNRERIARIAKDIAGIQEDAERLEECHNTGWVFKPMGPMCPEASASNLVTEQIGAQILQVNRDMPKGWCGEVVVGSVAGMTIILARYDGVQVSLQGTNRSYRVDRSGVSITSMQATGQLVLTDLIDLIKEPKRQAEEARRLELEVRDIEQRLGLGFEYQDKLDAATARQREIEAALDLDKDEAGTTGVTAAAEASA